MQEFTKQQHREELNSLLNDGRPKCRLERLAIERELRDLDEGEKRGLVWDGHEAYRAIEFFKFLNHWKGPMAGKPFELAPFQRNCVVAPLMGWYKHKTRKDGGQRRFRKAGIEWPRKNGKSSCGAGLALHGLIADGEEGPEVYSAATARDQASIIFESAQKLPGKELREQGVVRILKNSILCEKNNGVLKPLSSDYNSLWGLNLHKGLVDELHAHPNRKLWDSLQTSVGGRANPQMIWISTAGFNRQSIWYEEHVYCKKILKGEIEDDSYLVYFTGIDEEDIQNWDDPEVHRKANPNYDILDKDYFENQVKRAQTFPQERNTFLRMHLNCITEQEVLWMPMEIWDQNSSINFNDKNQRTKFESSLLGKKCFGAFDLATTRDLSAWGLVFPEENDHYKLKVHHFAPKDASTERVQNDRQGYQKWADEGLITLTPGYMTDYNVIIQKILDDYKKYDIQTIAFDPYNASILYQKLIELGVPEDNLVQFAQRPAYFNEPMNRFLELIKEQKIEHANDPVLRWEASNITVKEDSKGYITPSKIKSQDKIDGMITVFMALALALQQRDAILTPGTYYENHELELF